MTATITAIDDPEHRPNAAVEPAADRGWRWRDHLPIHPAANVFPSMNPEELKVLGEDILAHGMTSPIVFLLGGKAQLLDGRSRLDALELVGADLQTLIDAARDFKPEPQLYIKYVCEPDPGHINVLASEEVNPFDYVISANAHRRHLTTAQKAELIEALLKAKPERSDRATAKIAKTSHRTVATKRKELERGGQIAHQPKRLGSDGKAHAARKPKAQSKRSKPPEIAPIERRTQPEPSSLSAPPQPESGQIDMFLSLSPPAPSTPLEVAPSEGNANEASRSSPQSNGHTAEPEHPLSIRIPFHPIRAAAVLVKKFSREQLRRLIEELQKIIHPPAGSEIDRS